ncbi:hypothetical protein [Sphingomonas oryzagri]
MSTFLTYQGPLVSGVVALLQAATVGGLLTAVGRRFGKLGIAAGIVAGVIVAAAIAVALCALTAVLPFRAMRVTGGVILLATGVHLAWMMGCEDAAAGHLHPLHPLLPRPPLAARGNLFLIGLWCTIASSIPVIAVWVGTFPIGGLSPAIGVAAALAAVLVVAVLAGRAFSRVLMIEIAMILAITAVVTAAEYDLVTALR